MSADVKEMDKMVEVHLEAPGMKRDDFDINVSDRTLFVRGTKHFKADRDEGRLHITERAYGSFERLIPLPCAVYDTEASANYKHGVLYVSLPKKENNAAKQIPVR